MPDRLPSPSGARLAGDDFQHAITWLEALRLLQEDHVTRIEFEVGDAQAGITDDLVVHRGDSRPNRYTQIKFAVDDATPLTYEWFMTEPRTGSQTPLRRFHDAFSRLSKNAGPSPELELLTNRQISPNDPLLRHRSGLNGKLVPRALAIDNAETRVALEAWREHLGVGGDDLRDFLEHFKVSPNRGSLDDLRDRCRDRMEAVGLRGDEAAVVVGVAIIRRLIEEGTRELDADALRSLVAAQEIEAAPAIATLLIQEIDHRPLAHLATAHVDWVEYFIGDMPDQRRQLHDSSNWNSELRPDLQRAVSEIRSAGHDLVRIEGAYRLPTAFVVGLELNERSGMHVVIPTRDGEWSSTADPVAAPISAREIEIGDGEAMAVVLSFAADIAADVEADINENGPSTSKLLVIEPEAGPGRQSVGGPGEARFTAEAVVDELRTTGRGARSVNLYMACPGALAVFLGRVWNRVPSGWVLADLNPGYVTTYRTGASAT
jgi:hypothetical protein